MLELGIPFSDPLADGPVIHDAATARARRRPDRRRRDRRRRGARAHAPGIVMTYANVVLARGTEGVPRAPGARAGERLIVPDLPHEEAEALALAAADAGVAARAAGGADDDRGADWRASGRPRAASSMSSRSRAPPASGARGARKHSSRCSRRARAHHERSGRASASHLDAGAGLSGSRRRRRRRDRRLAARARGRRGADAAAAVGGLVGQFADALR